MTRQKHDGGNPTSYVTKTFCDERFNRTLDKVEELKRLYLETSNDLKTEIRNMKDEKKEESHFWRNLLGTMFGGAIIALIAWIINNAHF
jgi:hypothetical protein